MFCCLCFTIAGEYSVMWLWSTNVFSESQKAQDWNTRLTIRRRQLCFLLPWINYNSLYRLTSWLNCPQLLLKPVSQINTDWSQNHLTKSNPTYCLITLDCNLLSLSNSIAYDAEYCFIVFRDPFVYVSKKWHTRAAPKLFGSSTIRQTT